MTAETISVLHEVYGHLLRLLPRARQYVGKEYFCYHRRKINEAAIIQYRLVVCMTALYISRCHCSRNYEVGRILCVNDLLSGIQNRKANGKYYSLLDRLSLH